MLKTALEGLGGLQRFIKPGQVVAIKPNATWAFRPHTIYRIHLTISDKFGIIYPIIV